MVRAALLISAIAALALTVSAEVKNNVVGAQVEHVAEDININRVVSGNDILNNANVKVLRRRSAARMLKRASQE
ncbi:hypothetical protein A0J61_05444 [Choanephora cucurbitarum]|uniref:RxLR effector protein n=1 Tax=Choanephora cucurbitarum TaxID=101091 RepID=A0A1C7NBT0_9FUNG|nr:hypothetical protein A0J61_05444 [Choanephora cucurbitarum]